MGLVAFISIYSYHKLKMQNDSNSISSIKSNAASSGSSTDGIYSADELELNINQDEDIVVYLGARVEFLDGFVTTKPYKYAKSIKYFHDNVELTDKSFVFNTVGVHTIDLVSGDSKLASFNVTVVDDDSAMPFKQKATTIRLNQTKTIAQMFSLPADKFDIGVSGSIDYQDNILQPVSLGDATISFTTTNKKIKVSYSFDLMVIDEPEFELVILEPIGEVNLDLTTNSKLMINYSINPTNEYEDMSVNVTVAGVEMSNDKILIMPPLIRIDFEELKESTNLTTATIIISLTSDPRVKAEVKVNFK